MILFLDSAGFERLHFALIPEEGKPLTQTLKITYQETEKTLAYLDAFLKKNRIKISDLKKIVVVSGPGSFTGIRVGVSLGLAISFANDIPLYSLTGPAVPKKLEELRTMKLKKVSSEFDPEYGAEPNITLKK